jgi:hypothetical protein
MLGCCKFQKAFFVWVFFVGTLAFFLSASNAARASGSVCTATEPGNWSSVAWSCADDPTQPGTGNATVPGNGDHAIVRLSDSGILSINQNLGSVGGGGIKTIRLEGGTLNVNSAAARAIVFGSTGTDPVGTASGCASPATGASSVNPCYDASMYGFFVAKGTLDLRAAASPNILTIKTDNGTSPWYIHHAWGDFVNGVSGFNAVTVRLQHVDAYNLGENVAGFRGIEVGFNSAGNTIDIRNSRFHDPYKVLYKLGSNTSGTLVIDSNHFLRSRSSKTIDLSSAIASSAITNNTETDAVIEGHMVGTTHYISSMTFTGNAVDSSTSPYRRGLIVGGGGLSNVSGAGTISGNVAVGNPSASLSSVRGIDVSLNSGYVIRNNTVEAMHYGIFVDGVAVGADISGNFVIIYNAGSSTGHTTGIANFGGQSTTLHHNIIRLYTGALGFFSLNYPNLAGTKAYSNTVVGNGPGSGTQTAFAFGQGGNTGAPTGIPTTGSGNQAYNNLFGNSYRGMTDGHINTIFQVDPVWGAGVHHNATWNIQDYYYDKWNADGGMDNQTAAHPSYAYGDIDGADPLFVDPNRRVAGYDATLGGPGTVQHYIGELAKRSGFGGSYGGGYGIAGLLSWLQAGFAPRNYTLKAAGAGGADIGAVPVAASATVTQRKISINLEGTTAKLATGTLAFVNTATQAVVVSQTFVTNASGEYLFTVPDSLPASVAIRVSIPGYLARLISSPDLSSASVLTLAVPQFLAGDFNGDSVVNSLDYSSLNRSWNQGSALCDINRDGMVNSLDYAILSKNWSKTGE